MLLMQSQIMEESEIAICTLKPSDRVQGLLVRYLLACINMS